MKLDEVLAADDKLAVVKLGALKKKKNNPVKSKTTKMNSFIDMFGGMAGYGNARSAGSINPSAGSSS
jgi:hypothetical protein